LPEFDILQYLNQSFKRKLQSRVSSSDRIETNNDHFEHFIEKYFVCGYAVIACHAQLILYTPVLSNHSVA